MEFKTKLNNYIDILNCSSKELAEASMLSPAAISRYRNGERTPDFKSSQFNSLVSGIVKLAEQKNIKELTFQNITDDFSKVFGKNVINFDIIRTNLNELISKLNINVSQMARALGFDASYISRISNGQRNPANAEEFVNLICKYIVKSYSNRDAKNIVADIIKVKYKEIEDANQYFEKLQDYFFSGNPSLTNPVENFLKKLDTFDLNEYIKSIHFDNLKVPTMPFQLKSSKNYYGIEQMKNAELDFFKYTVLSKTKGPIFMYNDMPIEDMAKDLEFSKKWLFAIAASLKKGLHLNMIHNLNRPFNELVLGLEGWIPIYMTGQISPYYFKQPTSNIFSHTIYCSEVCAMYGEGMSKYHNKAKYYLTSRKDELPFYKDFSKDLLKQALPLMNIYTEKNMQDFEEFIKAQKNNKKNNIIKLDNKDLKKTFKNINFTICKGKWIIVTKNNSPKINFVIHHPTLRDAIENFVVPIIE